MSGGLGVSVGVLASAGDSVARALADVSKEARGERVGKRGVGVASRLVTGEVEKRGEGVAEETEVKEGSAEAVGGAEALPSPLVVGVEVEEVLASVSVALALLVAPWGTSEGEAVGVPGAQLGLAEALPSLLGLGRED